MTTNILVKILQNMLLTSPSHQLLPCRCIIFPSLLALDWAKGIALANGLTIRFYMSYW